MQWCINKRKNQGETGLLNIKECAYADYACTESLIWDENEKKPQNQGFWFNKKCGNCYQVICICTNNNFKVNNNL